MPNQSISQVAENIKYICICQWDKTFGLKLGRRLWSWIKVWSELSRKPVYGHSD